MGSTINIDPTYALAYAGLADAYLDASGVYLLSSEALPKSKAAAEHALKLDGSLAEAQTTLAYIKGTYDLEWDESEREFKRTIALMPGYARAHQAFAFHLVIRGMFDRAISEMERAIELDPLTDELKANLNWFYYLARRYDVALTRSRSTVKLAPNSPVAHYNLGMVLEQMGQYDEAVDLYNEAKGLDPKNNFISAMICRTYARAGKSSLVDVMLPELIRQSELGNLDPTDIGYVYAALGDSDKAFVWFEKAYKQRSESLLFLNVNPGFDSLRQDPRYSDLARRLRLAQ